MSYSDFKTVLEVANKFDIEVLEHEFIGLKNIQIPDYPFKDIARRLMDGMNFINEFAICESIIRPILDLVEKPYAALRIWTHVPYNVAPEQGLQGEPDYLIAPKTKQGGMSTPPLCIIEAKQEKLEEGWAQALAEMIAAQG